jgi:hypothetical protein
MKLFFAYFDEFAGTHKVGDKVKVHSIPQKGGVKFGEEVTVVGIYPQTCTVVVETEEGTRVTCDASDLTEPTGFVYTLMSRPFSSYTVPEGWDRFIDDGSQYGSVEYPNELPSDKWIHFSLFPLTGGRKVHGKTCHRGEYTATILFREAELHFILVYHTLQGEEMGKVYVSAKELDRMFSENDF